MNTHICKSCNHTFQGHFCNRCGEKIVDDRDFAFTNIVGQAIGAITNLDSKLFKTFKLLLFSPGKLSHKYVEGIRVSFMKPFQVFVISNIIFFLFLSEIDLFRTPSKWFFIENFDGIRVLDKVRIIAEKTGYSQAEVAIKYDQMSSNLAKGLIVFLIPFIACVGQLLHFREKIHFGKHVVFATHFFSFVLLLCVGVSQVVGLIATQHNKWYFILPTTMIMMIYYVLSTKNFYQTTWTGAILKGLVGVFIINIGIQFYRVFINLISLNVL